MDEKTISTAGYKRKPDSAAAAHKLTKAQIRYLSVKRIADIVAASAAIALLAFPMLLIALTLKILYPHVPVLFRQERVGRDGKIFTLIKFSSMKNVSHMENVSGTDSGVLTQTAADRSAERGGCVTKLGRFLRCTSLDELPQLFQVLSGEMSLIGPRPLILQEKEIHAVRWRDGVYRLRPGITGWAQVNGRKMLPDERKAAYDREYLEKVSFSLDWKIFWMTVKQVICREGVNE